MVFRKSRDFNSSGVKNLRNLDQGSGLECIRGKTARYLLQDIYERIPSGLLKGRVKNDEAKV